MSKPTKKPKPKGAKKVKVEDVGATLHKEATGYRLGEAIAAVNKTQRAIALKYGISPSKLGHWVRGLHYPDPYFLFQFCKDYSVTTDWIYREVLFGLPASLEDALSQQTREKEAAQPVPERRAPEKS